MRTEFAAVGVGNDTRREKTRMGYVSPSSRTGQPSNMGVHTRWHGLCKAAMGLLPWPLTGFESRQAGATPARRHQDSGIVPAVHRAKRHLTCRLLLVALRVSFDAPAGAS